MALMFPDSKCPICEQLLHTGTGYFGTSGAFFPAEHPLYRFCDAGIHWDCYEHWPSRAEFARGYFEMWIEAEKENPYWGLAYLSEWVAVQVNPKPPVAKVSVRLAATGLDIRVPLQEWTIWLADVNKTSAGLEPLEAQALKSVFAELQAALPDTETMLGLVDWEAKHRLLLLKMNKNTKEVKP